MNLKKVLLFFVISVIYACVSENAEKSVSVNGMQALTVKCDTKSKLDLLLLHLGEPGFDFTKLSANLNATNEVLVSAEEADNFKEFLKANEVDHEVVVEDISRVIKDTTQGSSSQRPKRNVLDDIFTSFPRYEEINDYLMKIAKEHEDTVEYITIGQSFEGRDIAGVKISSGGANKPSILVDAGIHAREWITITTALYAIKLLVEHSNNSAVFENVDIYIIPVLNPDGYEFTHQNIKNRMWRKTRSIRNESSCFGVDANRNFGHDWGNKNLMDNKMRVSYNPCSEIYAGPKAFSEPETVALKDFILSRKKIRVYLSLHAALGTIFYPWSTKLTPHVRIKKLKCTALKAAEAIASVRGTRYQVGTTGEILYPSIGVSHDWAIEEGGVELAYAMELPYTIFSFMAPVDDIVPVGQETFEAIKVFAKYAKVRSCLKL